MDTPGFKAWCKKTGINVELKEFADAASLVLFLNGTIARPNMVVFNTDRDYNGGMAGHIFDEKSPYRYRRGLFYRQNILEAIHR